MELRSLEYFVAVAEERSFTRAAARCHIVQPAISQQMQALEKELGEPLFHRHPREVTLTSAGEALMPYARQCLAAAAGAVAEFAARAGLLSGQLQVGTVNGVPDVIVPAVLGEYNRRYPGVAVRLSEGTSAPLIDLVRSSRLDAAIIAAPTRPLPGLSSHALVQGQVAAVVAAGSPLAGRDELTLREVSEHAVITYSLTSGLRAPIAEAFAAEGIELRVAYACNDVPLQVALAAQGVGVALVAGPDPATTTRPGTRVMALRPVITYRKILIWRHADRASAPLRAFLGIVEQHLRDGPQAVTPG